MLFGRRQGMGLTGVILVLAILYFTGAGAWLWNRVKDLDNSCYALLMQIGTSHGSEVCSGLGRVVQQIDDGVSGFFERL